MTQTDEERREHRRVHRIEYARQVRAMADGLAEWSRLTGFVQRERGAGWCGHDLLGKRPDWWHASECHGAGISGWWDHPRGFGRGRQKVVILAWPYGQRESIETRVRVYAERLGLNWHVGDAEGALSLYFWGATTPWALTSPGIDAAALFEVTSPILDQALEQVAEYARWRRERDALRAGDTS